jgi:hypothetical protein
LESLVFWAPCIFWLPTPCQMYRCNNFLPFCGQPLQINDYFFCSAEAF